MSNINKSSVKKEDIKLNRLPDFKLEPLKFEKPVINLTNPEQPLERLQKILDLIPYPEYLVTNFCTPEDKFHKKTLNCTDEKYSPEELEYHDSLIKQYLEKTTINHIARLKELLSQKHYYNTHQRCLDCQHWRFTFFTLKAEESCRLKQDMKKEYCGEFKKIE